MKWITLIYESLIILISLLVSANLMLYPHLPGGAWGALVLLVIYALLMAVLLYELGEAKEPTYLYKLHKPIDSKTGKR